MMVLPQLGNILGAMPSATDIFTQLALGAGTTVVLSGLQSSAGQSAIDPLHLVFHSPTTTGAAATSTTPAVAAVPQAVTILSAATFATLPAATQQMMLASPGGLHLT